MKVKVKPKENVSRAIKRFMRKVESEGIMRDIKRKRHYQKPSVRKKEKRKLAAKRRRKLEKRRRNNN